MVGSMALVQDTNEAHHDRLRAVPLSVICIIIISPSLGVPVKFVVNDVIACASPVIWNMSPLSVLIAGVADWVVATTRFVIRLFDRVTVLVGVTQTLSSTYFLVAGL